MGGFKLTKKAREDLKSIAVYTQNKWGKNQRVIYIKQFDDAFHRLAKKPDTGKPCDYIKPGYRKFPNSSHLIFYREISDNYIEIVRILHKRMDVEQELA